MPGAVVKLIADHDRKPSEGVAPTVLAAKVALADDGLGRVSEFGTRSRAGRCAETTETKFARRGNHRDT